MGTARLDRVGGEASRRAGEEGGRLHQQRQHRQRLAVDGRLAFAGSVHQRGRARRPRSARQRQECLRGQTRTSDRAGGRRLRRARRSSARRIFPIDALGSGSDYTAFLDFLQIASLDLGFGGDGGGGVYHSVYDSYYWYTHFSDGDFTHSAALSRVIGTALLRLADADVLPFEFKGTAAALRGYVDEIAKMPGVAGKLDLAPLRAAIDEARHRRRTRTRRRWRISIASSTERRTATRTQLDSAERDALSNRAGVPARGRAAEARMVQAPGLRARLLHRLWREDVAGNSRGDRTEAVGRGAIVRADRR